MKTNRVFVFFFIVALQLSLIGYPVSAQSAVSAISITRLDTGDFPQISLTARLHNQSDKPVEFVNAGELTVSEDDQEVEFTIQKTLVGITTILVLDINAASKAKPDLTTTNFETMKSALCPKRT